MRVTICIPTYNQAQYLRKAIWSAYYQSLPPIEIIVSDDCSKDDTPQVLELLAKEIPILKINRQIKNVGIASNTDACLRLATGDFIVRLDSDDYLSPHFNKKLAESLEHYPVAGYAHAAVQEIDQNGDFLQHRQLLRQQGLQESGDALKAAGKGYRVAANIIMFRRTALIDVGYLPVRTDFAEDYYLSAMLAAFGFGNVYLNETLSFYRVWTDAGKVRQRRKLLEIIGLRKVFEEVLIPSYRQRGWSLNDLQKNRIALACAHTDCLAWDVYTNEEKLELKKELNNLSQSNKVKLFSWLYLNGWGGGLSFLLKAKYTFKSKLKTIILSYLSFFRASDNRPY